MKLSIILIICAALSNIFAGTIYIANFKTLDTGEILHISEFPMESKWVKTKLKKNI